MAHKVIDRCKETTSTTGTGTLTLTGAVANFVAMADATQGLTVDGDTSWFCAENGAEWEVFLGTRVDATHLARTTVISSSNAGAAVSFTAAPTVFSTLPGSKVTAAGPAFSVYRATTTQSFTSGTYTKVQFNAETSNPGNCFDSTTNFRFQPNVAGYYQMAYSVYAQAASGMTYAHSGLYKNGTVIQYGSYGGAVGGTAGISAGSKLVYMNGTTDYVEVFGISNGTTTVFAHGDASTSFTGFLARPG